MVVSVIFDDKSPKRYDYLTDLPNLKAGDFVVVPTGPPPYRNFAAVKIVGLKTESERATAWVVQKVDVDGFQNKMEEHEIEAMFG